MNSIFDPKTLREAAKLSQEQCAIEWGVDQGTISRWEAAPKKMKRYAKNLYLGLKENEVANG